MPSLATDLEGWDTVLRKLAHLAEYALLGALVVRACRRAGLAVVLATLYAVTDEAHQAFVEGRHGAALDVAIDAVGALAGVLLWQRLTAGRTRA